jgi:D-alanyl-D-alanine carboxypeptidase
MQKLLFFILFISKSLSQEMPENVKKLMAVYPNQIIGYQDNYLIFSDNSKLLYNDKKTKTNLQLIENPDIEDMFSFVYPTGKIKIPQNDSGRIRNEPFFKKIYGNSKKAVENNLVEVIWCPKLVNQKIKVSTINGFDKIIIKISTELDQHPEFKEYISNIGGTFNWRKIAGTNRLSMHSFGMTIDINTKFSNYWQWDCNCKNENLKLKYTNKIPEKLVSIFEKYGFIWGGKWQHYDTMHFEYRPELF